MILELFEPPRAKGRRADAGGQNPLFPWLETQRYTPDPPAIVESETSRAAGKRIARHAPTLRERLVEHFRAVGRWGASDEEAAMALGIDGNSYRPRRVALARAGLIVAVGKRPTQSGDAARVWRLAEGAP
ncbi:MAG: hypothetical protein V1790_14410 [Planctomycetota bacterium]